MNYTRTTNSKREVENIVAVLYVILLISVYTDMTKGMIPNRLIAVGCVIGFITAQQRFEKLVLVIIVFIVLFVLHYILFVRKNKKYDKNKVPLELLYLVKIYNLNIKKINYRKFVWIYSLINTFIITTVYIIITYLLESLILQIIIGVILLILFIIICYGILGRYYMKKEGK